MNEKTKISLSWIVTVVMLPVIGLSGLRMINGIDQLQIDVQTMKVQQAVDHQQLQDLRVYMRSTNKPNDQ